MKKDRVESLKVKAQEIARTFSNPERTHNINKEVFKLSQIMPRSENVAILIYDKIPTGKKALVKCEYINSGTDGYWTYMFPTYGHIAGYEGLIDIMREVESFNFERN